jgi:hypothetical protein
MQTKFKVWLGNSHVVLPPDIWQGITIVKERWFAADGIFLLVDGDGADVDALVNQRKDVFSFCERDPDDLRA